MAQAAAIHARPARARPVLARASVAQHTPAMPIPTAIIVGLVTRAAEIADPSGPHQPGPRVGAVLPCSPGEAFDTTPAMPLLAAAPSRPRTARALLVAAALVPPAVLVVVV